MPRRTFIRGVYATIALPLLDAMIPSLTPAAETPAASRHLRRLGFVYMPMGSDIDRWTPATPDGTKATPDGKEEAQAGSWTLDKLSPSLESLESVKKKVAVISNLELMNAYPGTHATSNSAFLSAAKAKWTESSDYRLATTVDQIAAKNIGQATRLPSLELAMDLLQTVGQGDNGYACVYQNNLSWASPTTPLPAEAHPRLVFEKLFGEGGTPEERRASLKRKASLLDWMSEDISRLQKTLGSADRTKVDEYLEAVREVERRVQRAEAEAENAPATGVERPLGVPELYGDHCRLMFDLQVLALQADVTRVITFQMARETSNRTYPEIGVPDPHHPLTHHGGDKEKIAKMAKINHFHVSLFAYFLEKLDGVREGSGSLLDHTLYLYGSGMGDPNLHDHTNLPILVAGGAAGKMRGGRHIRYEKAEPLASLHLTLLDKVGVELESFADSNGKIDELFGPLSV